MILIKNYQNYRNIKTLKVFLKKAEILELIQNYQKIDKQKFNKKFIDVSGKRYLISRYGEDRIEMLRGSKIAKEGRIIHLGIDIFSKNLEVVYAPFDAEIIKVGREEGNHSFGHYIILQTDSSITKNYIFLAFASSRNYCTPR